MSKTLPPPPQPPQADTSVSRRLTSLAPPLLLADEDPTAYQMLLEQVSNAAKPADFIEEILVRGFVDDAWDGLRYRRLKAALLNVRADWPLQASLDRCVFGVGRPQLEGEARMAMTLDECLDAIERIEQLIALADARRAAALREIDRHRDVLAQRLRQAVREVEAEYEVLDQHTPLAPPKDNKAA